MSTLTTFFQPKQMSSNSQIKSIEDFVKDKLLTPVKFSYDIEKLASNHNMNYIDAIVHYCEENDIEYTSVSKLISKPLKEKLKIDAQKLNYIKKTSRAKLFL